MEGVITRIEKISRKSEYAVYVDGERAFDADEELLLTLGIREGERLSEEACRRARLAAGEKSAKSYALRLLASRSRTTEEVRRRLNDRGFGESSVEAVVAWLASLGYLDDRAFARNWIEMRSRGKPMGKRALFLELRQKGIERCVLDEVLADIDSDTERRLAYEAARSRLRRMSHEAPDRVRRRIESYLYRRGFGPETIRAVVSQVLSSDSDP